MLPIYPLLTPLLLFWLMLPFAVAANESFNEGLIQLQNRSFSVKVAGIEAITRSGDPRSERLFQALLAGELYQQGGELVYSRDGASFEPLEGGDLRQAVADAPPLKRLPINNTMRNALTSALALIRLNHPDPAVRLAAITALYSELTPDLLEQLRQIQLQEQDAAVKEALTTAWALGQLRSSDPLAQLNAIAQIGDSLEPVVRNELSRLVGSGADSRVERAAQRALKGIEQRSAIYANLERIFFGLSLGSVLVLSAIGLAITFGVMGVINMAHGELMMLGAYTAWGLQQLLPDAIGTALLLSIPLAFLVSGATGVVLERTLIRHLYGRPLETLLATFGVSLILQQLVRTVISPQNVPVANPDWLSGSLVFNSLFSITYNRLAIIGFALFAFLLLLLILKRTTLGLQVRAVAQNRSMAQAMGVRSARVDALTFGLGSGIAGIAGVALSQLTNVGPNLGQTYIIDSFMVVVFGGVGNLWGTLVAGLSLGVADKFLEPLAGAVLAKIAILIFIILFIQKRPRGLFPQKGRAVEA